MNEGSHHKLKSLECFHRVEEMLKSNVSFTEIARFIQEDAEEYQNAQRDSVRKAVSRYYHDEVPDIDKVKHSNPDKIQEYEERLEEEIDVLQEFREMYFHQKDRVIKLRAQEENMGKTKEETGEEIDRAVDIMNKIAEHRKDIGMDDRHLGEIKKKSLTADISADATGVDNSGFIMDPNKREKVVTFFDRLRNADDDVFEEIVEDMGKEVIEAEYEEIDDESDNGNDA